MVEEKYCFYLSLKKQTVSDIDFTALEKIGRYEFKGKKTVVIYTNEEGPDLKNFLINQIGLDIRYFGLTNKQFPTFKIWYGLKLKIVDSRLEKMGWMFHPRDNFLAFLIY